MYIRQAQYKRRILHIDFDSFFASVEQQEKPELRGKPMGVTAQNGRTCIIASSREAKKLGIKTGDRTWESIPKCPELILVPADFNKYYEVSKKFLKICKDYSPFVEMFSLDELFLDVTSTENLFGGVQTIIKQIKERIRNEIGEYITVSIGISYNKLLAKLASGINKPNGIFEINQENFNDVYKKAKLTDLCGIGERVALRLNRLGVYNMPTLQKIDVHDLISEFGKVEAIFLKNLSFGINDEEVIPYTQVPETKSVGRNYCLPRNEYNKKVVLQNIFELCEEVAIRLRELGKAGKTISLFLDGSEDVGRRKTIPEFIDKSNEIFKVCQEILGNDSFFFKIKNFYVRQIHISVSSLEDLSKLTPSLFDEPKKSKVVTTIDKINKKFGDHTIRNGFLLYADKLTTVPNGYFADRVERTKLASEVFE